MSQFSVVAQFEQDPSHSFGMTDRVNGHSERSEESFLMPTRQSVQSEPLPSFHRCQCRPVKFADVHNTRLQMSVGSVLGTHFAPALTKLIPIARFMEAAWGLG
jgi:hypothetical protein